MDNIHSVLRRQVNKCNFTDDELADEKLQKLISKINQSYIEFDKGLYLMDRSLELSSQETKALYETIKQEKINLQAALKDLLEKDALVNKKNTELTNQTNYANSLLASIVDMLFVIDVNMTITDINKSVEAYFNKPKSDIIGLAIDSIFTEPSVIDSLIKSSTDANGKKSVMNVSNEIILDANKKIPVLISASVINDEKTHVICITKDMSALKKLELDNANKQSMLVHAGRLAALGEMATGVAHELNQPLAIIRNNMQAFQLIDSGQLPPEEMKEIVESTIVQVDRAAKIINHMRGYARMNQGTTNKIQPLNVTDVIEAALSMFNEQFRLHEINVVKNFEPALPQVAIESQELEQVVINFLSNAKYAIETMRKKIGKDFSMLITINVRQQKENGMIVIEVVDNGIGMNKEVLERCLEPFYTTKEIGKGTGLGLSIIYTIIKNYNGNVEVESEPDHGATFRIMLPFVSE